MIVLGADTHKRSHTIAAVDAATGQVLAEKTIVVGARGPEGRPRRLTLTGVQRHVHKCRGVVGDICTLAMRRQSVGTDLAPRAVIVQRVGQ
jgi:hypothetical protein